LAAISIGIISSKEMKKLDRLYLELCYSCGVDAATAGQARQEFLVTVHELMQYMNSRFDSLNPKRGLAKKRRWHKPPPIGTKQTA
jgi:hypothetical protein